MFFNPLQMENTRKVLFLMLSCVKLVVGTTTFFKPELRSDGIPGEEMASKDKRDVFYSCVIGGGERT